jgi:hypothetical protein
MRRLRWVIVSMLSRCSGNALASVAKPISVILHLLANLTNGNLYVSVTLGQLAHIRRRIKHVCRIGYNSYFNFYISQTFLDMLTSCQRTVSGHLCLLHEEVCSLAMSQHPQMQYPNDSGVGMVTTVIGETLGVVSQKYKQ